MKLSRALFICSLFSYSISLYSNAKSPLTIEEQRLGKAQEAMPGVYAYFDWSAFKSSWVQKSTFSLAQQSLSLLGNQLWQYSKEQAKNGQIVDDRPVSYTHLTLPTIYSV